MAGTVKNTKRALVTGAGGFIASHLTQSLLDTGRHVRALVHYNSRGAIGWLGDVRAEDGQLEVHLGDVTDPFQMAHLTKDIDEVFHLAALIGIPYSYAAPESYVRTNVQGTLNLLQAALKSEVCRFVHTSTSEVYGSARYVPIDEEHPLQSQSPYAATKTAADKLVESFGCAYGLAATIVRPFNTYGPRQSARAVIPSIISQALAGPEIRLGSLDPVRDLTFVTDTAAGFIAAAETEAAEGEVLNLGTGQGVAIGELAETIFELLDGEHRVVQEDARVRPEKSEVMRLISSNARMQALTGWTPRVSLREGLARTVAWIRERADLYRASEYAV